MGNGIGNTPPLLRLFELLICIIVSLLFATVLVCCLLFFVPIFLVLDSLVFASDRDKVMKEYQVQSNIKRYFLTRFKESANTSHHGHIQESSDTVSEVSELSAPTSCDAVEVNGVVTEFVKDEPVDGPRVSKCTIVYLFGRKQYEMEFEVMTRDEDCYTGVGQKIPVLVVVKNPQSGRPKRTVEMYRRECKAPPLILGCGMIAFYVWGVSILTQDDFVMQWFYVSMMLFWYSSVGCVMFCLTRTNSKDSFRNFSKRVNGHRKKPRKQEQSQQRLGENLGTHDHFGDGNQSQLSEQRSMSLCHERVRRACRIGTVQNWRPGRRGRS